MFTPEELEGIPLPLEQGFKDLESRIMSDIIRRIKINGEVTRSADWQIYRLQQLGKSKAEIKAYIQQALKLSDSEIDGLYSDVVETGYARDKSLYETVGKPFIPFAENKGLQQLLTATAEQTRGELKNITQSLGFATKQDGKVVFSPLADYYQKTLDGAMLDISSGTFDYNTVLKRTVSEMTNSGLRTVDYATGWSNRVEVAARRSVMTGFNQVTAKINDDNAKQLETETFEISWHSGARPSHQEWQGKWYTKEQLHAVCGLGTVEGLCGANCYHSYFPVIPGISEPTYTAEQLAEMNAKENVKREYDGKEYNAYEASQHQRKMEILMRKQRQDIKLLQEGGADEDEIIFARSRYRSSMAQYAEFSKKMDLPQQRERITVDGLGKYKKTVGIKENSGIIKEKEPSEVRKLLQESKIEYKEVQKLAKQLSDDEIIQRLGGGDLTSGSCSSLAFAYSGNRCKLDVLDFRGGISQSTFSSNAAINEIAGLPDVKGTVLKEFNDFSAANKLLKTVESGKEYYLSAGQHAAIIRKTQSGFEYLELQSATSNGFKPLTTDVLKRRFGCKRSHTVAGTKMTTSSQLIECESLGESSEFKELLGYINTSKAGQMKGVKGSVK